MWDGKAFSACWSGWERKSWCCYVDRARRPYLQAYWRLIQFAPERFLINRPVNKDFPATEEASSAPIVELGAIDNWIHCGKHPKENVRY
jgi:hypothetical protein